MEGIRGPGLEAERPEVRPGSKQGHHPESAVCRPGEGEGLAKAPPGIRAPPGMGRPHRRDQGSLGSRDGTRRDSDLGFANWPDSFFLKLKGGQQAPKSRAEDQLWARRWQEAGALSLL